MARHLALVCAVASLLTSSGLEARAEAAQQALGTQPPLLPQATMVVPGTVTPAETNKQPVDRSQIALRPADGSAALRAATGGDAEDAGINVALSAPSDQTFQAKTGEGEPTILKIIYIPAGGLFKAPSVQIITTQFTVLISLKKFEHMFLDRAAGLVGWQASPSTPSGSVQWFPAIAINAGLRFQDTTINFGGGPRLIGRPASGKFLFFGQFLVGAEHFNGGTGFSGGLQFELTPGGGVMIPVPHHHLMITGQIDFPIDFFTGGHVTGKQFTFGVALPLGGGH